MFSAEHPHYKWVALSNTTLGTLIATVNSSIVLISLPAIFNGIKLDPLGPGKRVVLDRGGRQRSGRAARR